MVVSESRFGVPIEILTVKKCYGPFFVLAQQLPCQGLKTITPPGPVTASPTGGNS